MKDDVNEYELLAATQALPRAVRVAERLRAFVDWVGRWGAWLSIPVVLVTCLDIVIRKLAYEDEEGNLHSLQLFLTTHVGGIFNSTILQELEWHFHAGLFLLVLGYGMVYNTHVRIDLIRENLAFRKQAWLELLGLSLFMIPFCVIVLWFALDYTYASYTVSEISPSTVGLTHRWLIKSVLVIGLILALISGIAVWLQVYAILWGPKDLRFPLMTLDWPEDAGMRIEGKERVKLEDSMDALAAPDEAVRERTTKILSG